LRFKDTCLWLNPTLAKPWLITTSNNATVIFIAFKNKTKSTDRDLILSLGNTEDYNKMFLDFRGHKPDIKPMLIDPDLIEK